MTDYRPPLVDIMFALKYAAAYERIAMLPGFEDASPDVAEAILTEAAKFTGEVLAPLNQAADQQGCVLGNGEVQSPDGFKEAYARFRDGGWLSLPFDEAYGGQGLPWVLGSIVQEMCDGANMAWALCTILSRGAMELLSTHGSPPQKDIYLRRLISGEWSGTMNLTEPQAGTDLSLIKTLATPEGDHFRLRGQKIFITWGEQDMTANIVHLVLARTPDAPPGVRGISLFLVPKHLVDEEGEITARNDLECVALEKKLGIRGSATCVMSYGEEEGAVGYLVGEEGRGLANMFTMMNNERLAVALQSVAISDRAYQQARDYARERVQSRPVTGGERAVTIIHHADVRRMLMAMKSRVDAGRALCYYAFSQIDVHQGSGDEETRNSAQKRLDLLTPVTKGWCADVATEITSLAIQVHGGAGFIEETGVAQYYRDSRICSIYEGTTGIQANDLVLRKVLLDGGAGVRALLQEMRDDVREWGADEALGSALAAAIDDVAAVTDWILEVGAADQNKVAAGAYHYLMLCGYVVGGWLLLRSVRMVESERDDTFPASFATAKRALVRFYCEQYLALAPGWRKIAMEGDETLMALAEEMF